MESLGKKFEQKIFECWHRYIPNSFFMRIPDQVSGYKTTSQNLCDFIGYAMGNLYLLECKEHKGASFPFSNLSQYDRMKEKVGISGVRVGVIVWLSEKDRVFYVPISTITQMMKDGKKSVGIKALEEKLYNIVEIPSIKKRTFMDSDLSILLNLKDGE